MRTIIPQATYLSQASTLEELNRQYRKFALKLHPDRGGNLQAMQELNAELDFRRAELSRPKSFTWNRSCHRPWPENSHSHTNGLSPAAQRAYDQAITHCPGVDLRIESGTVIASGPSSYIFRERLKSYGFWWEPTGKYWHFVRAPKKAGVA